MPSKTSNFFMKAILNSPFHRLLGKNFAVVTLKGRRTGNPISTPINVLPVDGVLTTVSLRSRTWWRNLRQGRTASLRWGGRQVEVGAEVIELPDVVAAGLDRYFQQYPQHARYYHVPLSADHHPAAEQLRRLAEERVLIRLTPIG